MKTLIASIIVKFIVAFSKVKVNRSNICQVNNKFHNPFRRAKYYTKDIVKNTYDLSIPLPFPKSSTEEELFLFAYDLKTFGNSPDPNIKKMYRYSTMFRTSSISNINNNNIDEI